MVALTIMFAVFAMHFERQADNWRGRSRISDARSAEITMRFLEMSNEFDDTKRLFRVAIRALELDHHGDHDLAWALLTEHSLAGDDE